MMEHVKIAESKKSADSKMRWLLIGVFAFFLWGAFGTVPYIMHLFNVIDFPEREKVVVLGGIFSAGESFFSAFALIAVILSLQQQKVGLKMQKDEFDKTFEMQRNTMVLQIVMPFMDLMSSNLIRESILKLVKFTKEVDFEARFASFIRCRDQADFPEEEKEKLEEIDRARRHVVGIFHKMYRLAKTDVVEKELARVVIGPDSVYLLKHAIEPLERAIRDNYDKSIFSYFYGLYSEEEVEKQGKHDRS